MAERLSVTGPDHGPWASVWATAQQTQPVQRRGRYVPESLAHPARMLPAIAAHAIAAYTRHGDIVLDPMCGIGTTVVEAMHAGRDGVGVEYEARWADLADANIRHTLAAGVLGRGMAVRGDGTRLTAMLPQHLHGQVSLVVTSPPYGPTVHGHVRPSKGGVAKSSHTYGDPDADRGNLAFQSQGQLVEAFTQILRGCRVLLKPGGVAVITARPYRVGGDLIDLPSAVISAGLDAGLTPVERCVALLAGVRDGRLIARPSFFQLNAVRRARQAGVPLHLIVHEDVLVLANPHPDGQLRLPASLSARTPETPS
ncbi:TRM11 family SAM-dependent methyltransferase [Micromonospora sp. DT4]|uniref:TRM11 family SAM-dependent methyltransferase n=1 Tax=Micromonospora sp. DT4 TaxID=3393438 RepID=UPI003CF5FB4F